MGSPRLDGIPNHHQNWLECIRTRKRTVCDAEVGCRSTTVSHLGSIAHRTGRALLWDPIREEFIGDEELKEIRLKLDAAGVRLLTYYFHQIPGDEESSRRVFEFGRKIGIEAFLSEPAPEALDAIERRCEEYGIDLAIHNHDRKASPRYWNPQGILEVSRGRSRRIGACGDLGYWIRSGIDPIEAVKALGERLISLQVHDLSEKSPEGHDVPWGTGAAELGRFFEEVRRLGLRPTCFGLEYSYDWLDSLPEMAQSRDFFEKKAVDLAG